MKTNDQCNRGGLNKLNTSVSNIQRNTKKTDFTLNTKQKRKLLPSTNLHRIYAFLTPSGDNLDNNKPIMNTIFLQQTADVCHLLNFSEEVYQFALILRENLDYNCCEYSDIG